ncbi:F-box protein CPR1-like isoform X2 [Cornus florida]|uniref:F-box protein CPR1-like isoform X2 n=1 Tax=Cornus florida TaxID=4283 RepID=UPI0028A047B7|nr:F-box protein CPR1-like isoform X2 [Cornus florida]
MSNGVDLPVELLVDILYRLPAKSLGRFKCVAKSWYSLISNPNFAKTHLDRNNTTTPESVLLISDYLYSVDCTKASINDSLLATKLGLGLPRIENPHEFEILGSCNGLVLFMTEVTMLLLNPLTMESQTIPESPFNSDSFDTYTLYGLGYDSSADDYKVLTIDFREDVDYVEEEEEDYDEDEPFCNRAIVRVYSLKTDSWRRIHDVPHSHSRLAPCSSSLVLVSGCLHWFIFRSATYLIAAFDVADEKFGAVQMPSSLDDSKFNLSYCSLGVLGGCLCLLVPHQTTGTTTDIWVMKEYGVTESWTKFTSVRALDMYMMKFLCFVDGEVIFEVDGHNKFVAFNAKEKTRRDIVVCGIPTMYEAGQTYVESLVSPHHCEGDTQDGESHLGSFHFENANNQSCPSGSTSVPSSENCESLHYNGTGSVVATVQVVSLDPAIMEIQLHGLANLSK